MSSKSNSMLFNKSFLQGVFQNRNLGSLNANETLPTETILYDMNGRKNNIENKNNINNNVIRNTYVIRNNNIIIKLNFNRNYITTVRVNREIWEAFKEYCLSILHIRPMDVLHLLMLAILKGEEKIEVQGHHIDLNLNMNVHVAKIEKTKEKQVLKDELHHDLYESEMEAIRGKIRFLERLGSALENGLVLKLHDGTVIRPTPKYVYLEAERVMKELNALIRRYSRHLTQNEKLEVRELREKVKALLGKYVKR